MKIIVVDDSKKHRKEAETQLAEAGHEVTTLGSYADAIRMIDDGKKFDVALLDLLMPSEAMTLGGEGMNFLGESTPVGYPMAIKMALMGVGLVGVATDTNHHHHPASAIMDWFHGQSIMIGGSKVLMCHAPMNENGTKNWLEVLKWLLNQ